MHNELVESRITAERNALAVHMVQEMIAEIDYNIIGDLNNSIYWNTIQQSNSITLDRFVGEWMLKQSEELEDYKYKYDPKEGF